MTLSRVGSSNPNVSFPLIDIIDHLCSINLPGSGDIVRKWNFEVCKVSLSFRGQIRMFEMAMNRECWEQKAYFSGKRAQPQMGLFHVNNKERN